VPPCGVPRAGGAGRASRAVWVPSAYLDGLEVPFSVKCTRTFDVQQRARPALPRIRRAGAERPGTDPKTARDPHMDPHKARTAACLS